jgi:hypothetical protein
MQVMVITLFDSMHAQHAQFFRERFVIGHDHPAVAIRAEVFRRIKAETTHSPDAAGALPVIFRADGLGAIFDEGDAACIGQRADFIERRGLPK